MSNHAFNELTRVQLPAIVHLMRLGYRYLPRAEQLSRDVKTNIFPEIFRTQIQKLNPQATNREIDILLSDIQQALQNDDLGQAFFEKLQNTSGLKLVDFDTPENNRFDVTAELICGALTEDENKDTFRPDVTLLVNGMPLAFLEVKKPDAKNGLENERERMKVRGKNKKFRPYLNIMQLMLFSDNKEYLSGDRAKNQGAFYACTGYNGVQFNYFREEENERVLNADLRPLLEMEAEIKTVLSDFNKQALRHAPEFQTNLEPNSPTNRICTSLLKKDRLLFLLKYAFAYVKEENGLEKHIMRYPQFFALNAIKARLDCGIKKGIIWHTQGSGKTALAYYNVKFLTDYFQAQGKIPKFYFIVDRLDLSEQAKSEFTKRGLVVQSIASREAFAQEIKAAKVVNNHSGKAEITVVNIQKFKDDENVIVDRDYDLSVQRVFFIDEAHRSFGNQKNKISTFLMNLVKADQNAIHIGLTGTPLLSQNEKQLGSTGIFGDYIHTYYYNRSIEDGYTLRLIREQIETQYKAELQEALAKAKVEMGKVKPQLITASPTFVEPMLDYIVKDFENSRGRFQDDSIGAMVICDSSEQARALYDLFNKKYAKKPQDLTACNAANDELHGLVVEEPQKNYLQEKRAKRKVQTASLILHDEGDKAYRKDLVEDFKAGKTDLLIVYNMLLTGFDAPRLKKLYMARLIRQHNLLQALTRVNRTYKNFEYGYVVDFADIAEEFEKTNAAYQAELQEELGNEADHYSFCLNRKRKFRQRLLKFRQRLLKFRRYFSLIPRIIWKSLVSNLTVKRKEKYLIKVAKSLRNGTQPV